VRSLIDEQSSFGSTPKLKIGREHVHGKGDDIDIAGALAIAKQRALDTVSAGEQAKLRGCHRRTPVIMRMQGNNDTVPVLDRAAEPLDLVGVNVGRGHFHRGREILSRPKKRCQNIGVHLMVERFDLGLRIVKPQRKPKYFGEVVDLFCGAGALSHGLKRAGFKIVAGYDSDTRCRYAFETNNQSKFYARDVALLGADEIRANFSGKVPSVLAGCAPCQPFSTYKQRYDEDPRWDLVESFANLAVQVRPDFVTMENVPALERYMGGAVFSNFVAVLRKAGYSVEWSIAKCEEFGIPQKRRRLVLIASLNTTAIALKKSKARVRTVREAIAGLPPLAAGQTHKRDKLHVASSLSKQNLKRIRASTPGGTWRDWPNGLRADCHKRATGKTYPGVYARMEWDAPSPTMTTQCFGFGNGRFGHPTQDRAISLREAALLQTFPPKYKFLPTDEMPSMKEVGRWIGNAVPVKLAEAIGKQLISLEQNRTRP
jgi:DNA (cytosine-5)-methyltransferase 1